MEGCCYSGKKKGGEGEEFLLKTPQKKKKKSNHSHNLFDFSGFLTEIKTPSISRSPPF